MENLTARFSLIDDMSERLARIASMGQEAIEKWEQAGDAMSAALGGVSDGASSAVRAVDGVATSIDNLQEATDGASYSSMQFSDSIEGYTDSVDELSAAAERTMDATEELANSSDRAADTAEESSERGEKAAQTLAETLTSAGIVATVLKIADAFMEASKAAAGFQLGVMKISTIADTTSTSLSTIQGDIMALSMETGDSVKELSEAVYSAISASVDTADAVEFTATATKLAAGGFTSSATAVDVITTALNAYGLEASYAENISDMLITTQNLGKTSVNELAASVGKVIPLASAYGVEMDNLSAAYAELTKGGIATAEAGTYLKSMLNELGDSGSTVSAVLMEQTGRSFSELIDMGYSLGDVMDVLGTSVGGSAGAFNELWSSSEAGIGALSLYNAGADQFNTTLDAMQTSVGATAAAYEVMNNTTADAAEDMANAAANLQISIGQQINPLVGRLYASGTNILNFMTEFTQEHPVVVKAGTAVAIGLGTVAVAIAGVGAACVALKTAIPAIMSFGTAVNTALGPIGWVAMGISALVVAGGALIAMLDGAEDETAGMTAATREQYYELQNLNAEYEEACAKYGETSKEALRLQNDIDDLSAAFEANRQTVEEFTAEVDALCESVAEVSSRFITSVGKDRKVRSGGRNWKRREDDAAISA